jgi:hypothetical protein
MFRAVIHPLNDQPMLVDLDEMPSAGDGAVLCRNVRTIDGKRPKFIDRRDSTFLFPYDSIRFIEVYSGVEAGPGDLETTAPEPAEPDELEIDEDFLRRVREA